MFLKITILYIPRNPMLQRFHIINDILKMISKATLLF